MFFASRFINLYVVSLLEETEQPPELQCCNLAPSVILPTDAMMNWLPSSR